ncbi:MAG: phosphoglucomutase/phosphomannomutase family protein [Halococcoides sp.]
METPITFGTDGWRDTLDVFTEDRVRMVGQAVADYLDDAGLAGRPVAVGYDARPSSPDFADALAEVLAGNAHDVYVPERDLPTPLVAYAIVDQHLAGALMLTASHNPPEYNGVKFIPQSGAPALPEVTDQIEANLRDPDLLPRPHRGTIRTLDPFESYADHALDLVGETDVTVAYDAMHGSGRGYTDRLLERAGATVHRVRCEQDDDFGGTHPEPSPDRLQGLIAAVEDHDADLGVANDGDADRVAVVTPERGVLDENLLFAAIYEYLLETDSGPAIRSVSTTSLIDRIADAHDTRVVETPVGFKWIAEAMAEEGALMGGEESGGFSIRGHVREKDGVLMGLLAAVATDARPLDDRVDDLLATHGDIVQDKLSLGCPDDRKASVLDALADALPDDLAGSAVESVNDVDGFKIVLADGGWLLVRPSGTEPKLRIYAEADSDQRVQQLLDAGADLVGPLL